jgi:hypothetical protein
VAFYLAAFAATAIVLALTLNWRNDRLGFWVNGVMVGIADIPFILFVLIPGCTMVAGPAWSGALDCGLFSHGPRPDGRHQCRPSNLTFCQAKIADSLFARCA